MICIVFFATFATLIFNNKNNSKHNEISINERFS